MKVLPRIYLPMANRPEGYCVTNIEQRDLARRHGMDEDRVREHLHRLQGELASGALHPQKTATKTKRLIQDALNAVMQTGVRAR